MNQPRLHNRIRPRSRKINISSRNRRDGDNIPPRLLQMGQSSLNEMISSHQIRLKRRVPILDAVFDAQAGDVGDDDVDFAGFLGGRVDPLREFVFVGDVDYGADGLGRGGC